MQSQAARTKIARLTPNDLTQQLVLEFRYPLCKIRPGPSNDEIVPIDEPVEAGARDLESSGCSTFVSRGFAQHLLNVLALHGIKTVRGHGL